MVLAKLAAVAVAFLVASLSPSVYAQSDPCTATYAHNITGCLEDTTCDWCHCSAVPSTCVSASQAKKLPPSVFLCENATRTGCEAATTNATCAGAVSCSWCVTGSAGKCVNFAEMEKSSKAGATCFGPYQ
jgi:hypothetical protein